MTIMRLAYAVAFFGLGLGAGVSWSPLGGSSQMGPARLAVSDVQAENEEYVAQMREIFGEETAEFVGQFEDMSIRIQQDPIEVRASPDGRFVIRLLSSGETIASELRYPGIRGEVTELNRYYSFSQGDLTYSCDFGRTIDDSGMTSVIFRFVDSKGSELIYADLDADGRWDRFTDHSQEPRRSYYRDGLCWRERTPESDAQAEPENSRNE